MKCLRKRRLATMGVLIGAIFLAVLIHVIILFFVKFRIIHEPKIPLPRTINIEVSKLPPPHPSPPPEVKVPADNVPCAPQIIVSAKKPAQIEIKKYDGPLNEISYSIPPSPSGFNNYKPVYGGQHLPNAEPYDSVFYENYGTNPFRDTEDDNLSTFGIDVDDASFNITKRYLQDGHIPHKDSVRVEEFLNYFDYEYTSSTHDSFRVITDIAPSEFGQNCYLMRIGIKGKEIKKKERKPVCLTFVIDISGSMNRENRLELVKRSLLLLVDQLNDRDKIGIVSFNTNARINLEHTSIESKDKIINAIRKLSPCGSTFAEGGVTLGYKLADKYYEKEFNNLIILCSDGVANEGNTSAEVMLKKVKKYKNKGIRMNSYGFGMGNYNDVLLEKLANSSDGFYAYLNNMDDAKKYFVEKLVGGLEIIASDAKVQIEFNPEVVRSYRLLGYENRDIKDQDFRKDDIDSGEIGSGHSVTALYEIKLWKDKQGKIADINIRYEDPNLETVLEKSYPVYFEQIHDKFFDAPADLQFAACVAQFAEILRKSPWAKQETLPHILEVLNSIEVNESSKISKGITELTPLIEKTIQIQDKQESYQAGK